MTVLSLARLKRQGKPQRFGRGRDPGETLRREAAMSVDDLAASGHPGPPQRPALVVSHERSGTHFLMNTLAANFGYRPYTDVAVPGLDPRSTPEMLGFLLADWPPQTVLKSHHQVDFFPLLPRLAGSFHIFYVMRDPCDTLLSFWRFIAASPLGTGPLTATVGEFLRAAPTGSITLYDHRPDANMVARWCRHVRGWSAAATRLSNALTVVRYADLDERFAATVERLAAVLGRVPPPEPFRPSPFSGVIHPGPGGSGRHRDFFTDEDHAFVREVAGETLDAFDPQLG
jgi:Sulfotransferase domain